MLPSMHRNEVMSVLGVYSENSTIAPGNWAGAPSHGNGRAH
jgi:hypothetical protein